MECENTKAPAPAELPPVGLTEVGRFDSRTSADDSALVVLAMGLPYWLFAEGADFHLCVETPTAHDVSTQLALFAFEEKRRAMSAVFVEPWPSQLPSSTPASLAAFVTILVGVFAATRVGEVDLAAAGRLDAVGVFSRGEWWRTVTALTLHGDLAHLIANLGGGALFGHFAARRFGAGFAWLLIVSAGVLGNVATAWIYRDTGHLSLGASTAIFGALGLLAGRTLSAAPAKQHGEPRISRRPFLPLVAALVLLGLLGGGAAHIDVVAHLAGFVAGVPVGFLAGAVRVPAHRGPGQAMMAITTLALIAIAWAQALLQTQR